MAFSKNLSINETIKKCQNEHETPEKCGQLLASKKRVRSLAAWKSNASVRDSRNNRIRSCCSMRRLTWIPNERVARSFPCISRSASSRSGFPSIVVSTSCKRHFKAKIYIHYRQAVTPDRLSTLLCISASELVLYRRRMDSMLLIWLSASQKLMTRYWVIFSY